MSCISHIANLMDIPFYFSFVLQILSQVLDMVPSYFGIRLAALGSRKELVDLENWLSSNLTTYKDVFFEECLKFLKEIQFGVSRDVSVDHFNPSGAECLFKDESYVLEAHMGSIISSQLSEEVEKLTFMNANSRMKSSGATDSSPSDGYMDDIEAEANSYFHQMFSGQLTIDMMIQMLSRFKESPKNRTMVVTFFCTITSKAYRIRVLF
ncbi:hypothetical protein RHGRI_010465 [Rhododendron griersonianum]|uniref:Uncharacterized protein n=1 Tax=Rhododendron griersonianum TaxID=479676 RepID=A0AAV6KJA4_9ERIC|nr:hypothetical protein RHGRI_010465 [Rhododendron griersonianum]